jgi:hypothetical protein
MRLSDDAVLTLYPVEAYGHRWIGVVLPEGLWPVKAVAFSRHAEIVHSAPFVGGSPGSRQVFFLTWLPPGDDGPSRITKLIRDGGTSLVLHIGPWGTASSGTAISGYFRSTIFPVAPSRVVADYRAPYPWRSRGLPDTSSWSCRTAPCDGYRWFEALDWGSR